MYVSVIIPAYNEAERITTTLFAVHEYLRRQEYEYEIIVVNDGSKDETAHVVAEAIKTIPHLRCINNSVNHGKGWVVRQGMLQARGLYRVFMDADNSTKIDNLDRFIAEAKKGADVVISSRRVPGAKIEVPQTWIRDFLGGTFRALVHMLVPLGITDSQNGFKLFTARAAEDVFRRQRTFTWAFDVEVLAIAKRSGYLLKELPVHWVNDGRSHVTMKGMIRMLVEIMQIRVRLWFGLYYSRVAEDIV